VQLKAIDTDPLLYSLNELSTDFDIKAGVIRQQAKQNDDLETLRQKTRADLQVPVRAARSLAFAQLQEQDRSADIVANQPDWLRKLTEETGIVLIFDEVVTGFRWAYSGAQSYYGVTPDLATFGKVIGGGFPLAAIAGRREVVFQSALGAAAFDDPHRLELAQSLGEQRGRHPGNPALDVVEPVAAAEQLAHDERRPQLAQHLRAARHRAELAVIDHAGSLDGPRRQLQILDLSHRLALLTCEP